VAQKVEVVLTCDLDDDGVPAAETVVFTYDGQTYEFELCPNHLDEFNRVLGGYAKVARPAGAAGRRSRGGGSRSPRLSSNPSELAAVRDGARNPGFEVSDRGRIPAGVRQAYDAAQH
jgi:hypothetical protein